MQAEEQVLHLQALLGYEREKLGEIQELRSRQSVRQCATCERAAYRLD